MLHITHRACLFISCVDRLFRAALWPWRTTVLLTLIDPVIRGFAACSLKPDAISVHELYLEQGMGR